ncbi:hypothetical protein MTR67_047858 [Solanum verrucosum]|uniref:Disease resistance protein winged helix domain-containing protein n=1 Tax=Solanum verrucosum TaxID=315347 RepID=A0AAF0UWL5_SOLVR|nr:hypothetical protein MTR67_047858 [Solanum verrucosum]
MEESWWNEVKDSLFDYLECESEEYSRATMQLSFDNLADRLKPCVLYIGMFPEDARIPMSKLISLWIAEDFVVNIESAEDYLMDLISSNVVMVSKKEYNGLSSLEYLQLWNSDYFESKEWCLGDITFHKLMFLNLTHLRISRWAASEESFPLFETLVIKECYNLEEIPLSFADIPTLKHIKLIRCKNKPLEALALRIKDDVEENEGNDRIDLIIKTPRWAVQVTTGCLRHRLGDSCPGSPWMVTHDTLNGPWNPERIV